MKRKTAILSALGLVVGLTMTSPGIAQVPKMKMTTETPPGIATPDKLETRLGTLRLFDGVPDEETAQKVYDNLDFHLFWSQGARGKGKQLDSDRAR